MNSIIIFNRVNNFKKEIVSNFDDIILLVNRLECPKNNDDIKESNILVKEIFLKIDYIKLIADTIDKDYGFLVDKKNTNHIRSSVEKISAKLIDYNINTIVLNTSFLIKDTITQVVDKVC